MSKRLGLLLLPFLLLFCTLLFCMQAQQSSAAKPQFFAITHVTVIDATGAPAKPDMTVVIAGDRIMQVGKTGQIQVPKDAQVVDGTGKFLIPGLWDMHVHWYLKEYLPLFIANGVTGVRIMWGSPYHHEWRKAIDAGQLVGPRMQIASTLIDGPKPYWPGSVSVSSEAQARQAVIKAKANGADFIKVYSFLPREDYFAIADESKKQGVPFEGHLPMAVSAEEASRAGQKSFEHLLGVVPACSTRSNELLQAAQTDLAEELASGKPKFFGDHANALREVMLDTYSPEKAAALFAVLTSNGTWQCPTLTLLHGIAMADDPSLLNDSRLKYMPREIKASWDPIKLYGSKPEDFAFAKAIYQKDLAIVGAMQAAGVGLLAGTDTLNPFCFPGFSLHDELGLLVQGGLSPMQALQAATLNPARFMGRENDLGTVEKGKLADLVLLGGNPLDDIGNTRRIDAVVYGGKLFPRAALDKMLADAEALAARKSVAEAMMKTLQEKDVAAAVKQYQELKATTPTAYNVSENELITLGYQLMRMKKFSDAIEIFKLSVEAYPQSFNTYDSLAEAYMDNGDKALAIRNYQKSLELNPENTNAAAKLKELNGK